jgi:hypothetical protein
MITMVGFGILDAIRQRIAGNPVAEGSEFEFLGGFKSYTTTDGRYNVMTAGSIKIQNEYAQCRIYMKDSKMVINDITKGKSIDLWIYNMTQIKIYDNPTRTRTTSMMIATTSPSYSAMSVNFFVTRGTVISFSGGVVTIN